MKRHNLRRHHGHAAMAAGRVKWHTFAGGTGAHHGSSYAAYGLWGEYHISPPQHRGGNYRLKWANTHGMPAPHGGLWHDLGSFRSPNNAKKAAADHIKLLKSTAVG